MAGGGAFGGLAGSPLTWVVTMEEFDRSWPRLPTDFSTEILRTQGSGMMYLKCLKKKKPIKK